jgi:fibronectin type 3 domain-containing protein
MFDESGPTGIGQRSHRGTTNGGPYSKITSMNADTSYTDSSVLAGQTYFYVTTAVDGSGNESANSNQAQILIPTP